MNFWRIFIFTLALIFALPFAAAPAMSADANMQILADKIKADKKLVVAHNMKLSDAEAAKFWPIYDSYQKDLGDINKRTGQLIQDYATAYNKNAVTDDVAAKMMPEFLSLEDAKVKLQRTYGDRVSKELSPKVAARYMQIENKIRAMVDYALADTIPLVP